MQSGSGRFGTVSTITTHNTSATRVSPSSQAKHFRTEPRLMRSIYMVLNPYSSYSISSRGRKPSYNCSRYWKLVMAGYYVVKQGDHLSGIADAYGFPSYKKIWNHPNNGALKALRQNPNVLFPGDSVYLPDREEQSYSKPTDARHKFTLTSQTLL